MAVSSSWVRLVAQVLGQPVADIDRNAAILSFLGLGGTSLRAVEFAALAEERLECRVDVGALLGADPLASVVAGARPIRRRVPGMAPPPGAGRDFRDASALQTAMLLGEQLYGGSAFHLLFSADIRGRAERTRLLAALDRLTCRHEALRTVFVQAADGRMQRRILPSWSARLAEQTILLSADAEPVAAVHSLLEPATASLLRPFQQPPVVFIWTRIGAERSVLSIVIHHAIADGWSMGLWWREFADAYDGRQLGATAPSQDRLIGLEAAWATKRTLRRCLAELAGAPTVVELPSDLPRPLAAVRAATRLHFRISDAARDGCDRLASAVGVTRNAVLMAAWALVVARRAAVGELVLGLAAVNRPDADAMQIIGPCMTVLPVRCVIPASGTAGEYLARIASAIRASLAGVAVPFEHVAAGLGCVGSDATRNPLVQIAFAAHDELVPRFLRTADLALEINEGHCGGTVFDAVLYVQQWAGSPRLALEYRVGLLRANEATELAQGLDSVLIELADATGRPLSDIRTVTRPGRHELVQLGTGAEVDASTGLWQLIEERAAQRLGQPAVRDAVPDRVLTYRQLIRAVEAQSAALARAGVRAGDCVGLAVSRSASEIMAVLSLTRLGAAYTGIEPDVPEALARQMLDAAAVRFVLADQQRLAELDGMLPDRIMLTVIDPWRPPDDGDVVPAATADPSRVAYIAFTSGSTGVAKGVRIPGRGVVRLARDPAYLCPGACARFLRLAPLGFDASTLEIFAPLAAGGCIEIYPDQHVIPSSFADFVASRQLTGLWLTAGLFRLIADYRPDAFTGVRQLLTGGDVVPAAQVRTVLQACPGLRVSNGYGPTENTTFTAVHHLDDPAEVDDPLPIGRPIPGTRVVILDPGGGMVPRGGIGELYVYGDGLALGYAGMPEETSSVFGYFSADIGERLYRTGDFVRWDTAGRLHFLGRRDHQVKIRGFRIELEAVARVLRGHPEVQDAVVAVSSSSSGERRLVAGLVARGPGEGITGKVLEFAARQLPGHAMPALWAVVDALPVTANGKVDVTSLEEQALAGPAASGHAPPAGQVMADGAGADALERVIARSWTEVLGTRQFGTDDRFFEVGGDSLQVLRVAAILGRSLTSYQVTVQDLFAYPTIGGLASHLRARAEDHA